eukprot:NODE_350_length_1643_cov_576.584383.p1 GENE.NODE_350_length_1643_cov_576.584383~~NODE_350_length_1643_cov_576.584383.p1  ORF type:complete len:503 (+),score=168.32 NODE_350_length_1643_cov_576.584383:151-1509(+)
MGSCSDQYLREYREASSRLTGGPVVPQTHGARFRALMREVLASPTFEVLMGLVILVNTVTLGIDAELDVTHDSPLWLERLEHVFLSIYTVEICIKLSSHGVRTCFKRGWFIFDLVLVTLGVSYSWMVKPISVHLTGETGSDAGIFQRVIALRVLRLLRMIRALRMLPLLKASWRMVSGLLESWGTMVSMLVLLTLALYLFACLGLEVITKSESVQVTLQEHGLVAHFDSIITIMLTLTQFVTLDSCASIYYPIIKNHPELVFYFFPVIVIVSISLMNLVTAVLVEGGMALAHKDQRELRKEHFQKIKMLDPEFREFFRRVDADGSGTIQVVEMEHLALTCYPDALRDKIDAESLIELWDLLDADGSGDIDEAEFVDGLLILCLAEHDVISNDTLGLTKLIKANQNKSVHIQKTMQHVVVELKAINEGFARLAHTMERRSQRIHAGAPHMVHI